MKSSADVGSPRSAGLLTVVRRMTEQLRNSVRKASVARDRSVTFTTEEGHSPLIGMDHG